MAFDPLRLIFGKGARDGQPRAPLAGDQDETAQRLQIGFFGLGAMILLVGLANIIMNSVEESRATAVPEAAPTVVATQAPAPARDPLADAGVVPDLPAESDAAAGQPPGAAGSPTSAPVGSGASQPQN